MHGTLHRNDEAAVGILGTVLQSRLVRLRDEGDLASEGKLPGRSAWEVLEMYGSGASKGWRYDNEGDVSVIRKNWYFLPLLLKPLDVADVRSGGMSI